MATQQPLVLRPIASSDAGRLTSFFASIAADPQSKFFHPHPMTRETARTLCDNHSMRGDRYCIGLYGSTIVAYSMLRGWDEGYEVPSFGGCVSPSFRGLGLGRWILVRAMLDSRDCGAKKLRLTVYKENRNAVQLYRDLGFSFSDKNDAELIGIKELAGELPDCDESKILLKVSDRFEKLTQGYSMAGN